MVRATILCLVLCLCLVLQGCAGRRIITEFSGKIAGGDVKTYEKGKVAAKDIKAVWAYDSQLIRSVVGKNYEDEFPVKFKEAVSRLDVNCKKEKLTQGEEGQVVGDFAVVNWKWAEWVKATYGPQTQEILLNLFGVQVPF